MTHKTNTSKTAAAVVSVQLTQADAIGAKGQALSNTRIYIIDSNGVPTGSIMESGVAGAVPVSGGGGSGAPAIVPLWTAATALDAGAQVRATVAVGGFIVGEYISSNSSRTTGATFDATEAGNFTSVPEDTTILKKTDVVNVLTSAATDVPLSAAQGKVLKDTKAEPLVDGVTIKRVHGEAIATSGNAAMPASWTPTSMALSGLTLAQNLRAEEIPASGAVAAWKDAAGRFDATQATTGAQPVVSATTYNGFRALTFDGTDDTLATVTPVLTTTNNFAMFAVVKVADAVEAGAFIKNGTTGNTGYALGVGSTTMDSGTEGNDLIGLDESVAWRDTNVAIGTALAIVSYTKGSDNVPRLFVNGVAAGSFGAQASFAPTGTTAIGGYVQAGRFAMHDMVEIVQYAGNMSQAQRERIEGYLAHKFGLLASLAANHPYKTLPPTVVTPAEIGVVPTVVNNTLTSTSTTEALSAAQGKALQDTKAPIASPAFTGDATLTKTVVGLGPVFKLANDNYAAADKSQFVFEHGSTQNAQGIIQSNLPGSNDVDLEFFTTDNAVLNVTPALKLTGNNEVIVAANPVSALGAATKQYVDGLVAGLLDYRGAFTPAVASGATGYPTTGGSGTAGAILKGDVYFAAAVGFILTEAIQAGDSVVAKIDAPGQTATNWDKLNVNISYVPANDADVVKLTGAQVINGVKNFSTLPALIGDATLANEPMRKSQLEATFMGIGAAKRVTIHVGVSNLAITEALHGNAEIHLESSGNLTLAAAAVTTDTFGFTVFNTDAVSNRTLTPSGFTGVFMRDGSTPVLDLGNAVFDIQENAAYAFTVTINGGNKFLNIQNLNTGKISAAVTTALSTKQATLVSGTNIKTVNNQALPGSGNITITAGTVMPTRAWDAVTDAMANRTVHLRSNELTVAGALSTWTAAGGTSANGSQATASLQPTVVLNSLNSLAIADFVDNADSLEVGTVSTGTACTVIAVIEKPTVITINGQAVFGGTGGGQQLMGFNVGGGGSGDTTGKLFAVHEFIAWLGGSTTAIPSGWSVVGYVWDAAADLLSYFTNGSANGTASYAGAPAASGTYSVGNRNSATNGITAGMAEIMVFPVVLSATERQKAEGYLMWKYALQANLPVGHPYKNAAPTALDLPVYANNAAAIAGGLAIGAIYRNGADPDMLTVVH